ncbi:ABC transporter ATP-binding protein [Pseudodesulfovibrio aespoeensis]|uniref:ABC transporter ATP-binding protein n=1 Tax=Pseudodesulfovibrio aespoeensis TaxID=182210 RepID=UPI002353EBD8|nr:ABC transporter ATP-binding protein [Pseudodesulfovibrio aespoeensis]MCG2732011.1 ABC transporter ATP-binding protein [Pseudodesulfovibrio aespoeensis]
MSAENGAAIEVRGLAKRFGEVQAVRQVDFTVSPGELFGFLGPNGAGKTTTINMLTGLARPDAGSIVIDGIDCVRHPRAAQHLIGVVPDESNLYPELSGYDNLCFCAALYGMGKAERRERADELLEAFGLTQAAGRKFAGYSKGMKRKLTIAAGIIHRPRILFLDEPTTGIDVASARHLRQLIAELHEAGTTVFLTTHYIEEAERLCDRIAFILAGSIVRVDTVANLVQPILDRHVVQIAGENGFDKGAGGGHDAISARLRAAFPDLHFGSFESGAIRVEGDGPVRVGPLVRFLEEQELEVSEARRIRPSLEDVFVSITGIEADAMRGEKEKSGGPR